MTTDKRSGDIDKVGIPGSAELTIVVDLDRIKTASKGEPRLDIGREVGIHVIPVTAASREEVIIADIPQTGVEAHLLTSGDGGRVLGRQDILLQDQVIPVAIGVLIGLAAVPKPSDLLV